VKHLISKNEAFKFQTNIRVRWSECDRQGIAFNGSYLEYLEIAQSEYFRNLGYSIYSLAQTGFFDTVIVNVELSFLLPVKIDDILILKAKTASMGTTSMKFEVHIFNESNQLTTKINAVYVGYDQNKQVKKHIPADIRHLIHTFETDGLVLSKDHLPDLKKHI
tara:strand:+ start:9703 stop:10191 length:489 start_codon:yes stop_codon:yes gene_type:complete